MAKTASYHAGRLLGIRDGEAGRPVRNTERESSDFRRGYSDGYHSRTMGLRF